MLTGGWVSAAAMVMPTVTGDASGSVYTPGTHHCSPSWKASCVYYTVGISFIYLVTIPTMIICYVLITLKIKRSADRVEMHVKPRHPSHENRASIDLDTTSRANTEDTPGINLSMDENLDDQNRQDVGAEDGRDISCFQDSPKNSNIHQIPTISGHIETSKQQNIETDVKSDKKNTQTQKNQSQFRRSERRVAITGKVEYTDARFLFPSMLMKTQFFSFRYYLLKRWIETQLSRDRGQGWGHRGDRMILPISCRCM